MSQGSVWKSPGLNRDLRQQIKLFSCLYCRTGHLVQGLSQTQAKVKQQAHRNKLLIGYTVYFWLVVGSASPTGAKAEKQPSQAVNFCEVCVPGSRAWLTLSQAMLSAPQHLLIGDAIKRKKCKSFSVFIFWLVCFSSQLPRMLQLTL